MSNLTEHPAIVEITTALPPREEWKHAAPTSGVAATAHEASATLQASAGAAPLLAAVPSLAQPALWRELAYFDVQGQSGPAAYGTEFWNADLGGFSLQDSLANNTIFFAGTAWESANGHVYCYFVLPGEAPAAADCAFHVRLYGYGPDTWPADEPEQADIGFFVDDQPLGERQFQHWTDTALHARIVAGWHRFEIRQLPGSGSFLFQSASIWQTLVVPEGPAKQ